MKDTLFNESLADGEWGANLLSVADLQAWARQTGRHLKTMPSVDEFEFVQAEALISAIQRYASQCSPAEALAALKTMPELKEHRVFKESPDDPMPSHVWLLATEAGRDWRKVISKAIEGGELRLLNTATKLPIMAATPTKSESIGIQAAEPFSKPIITFHKIQTRKNVLSAVIEMAKARAVDQEDHHSVWAAFVELAASHTPPLVGYADGEVKFNNGDGDIECISKKNFIRRLKRHVDKK